MLTSSAPRTIPWKSRREGDTLRAIARYLKRNNPHVGQTDQIDHDLDQTVKIDQIDHDLDQTDQIDQTGQIDHDLDQTDQTDQIDQTEQTDKIDQIDQIDHDLDHLPVDTNLPSWDVMQELYSTDPTQQTCPRKFR